MKPSGTVSSLVSSASGIHPRYSKYYIRRVRADVKDPLASWMKENGFPVENDIHNPHNYVFSFPIKSPKNSVMKDDISAMEMLDIWKIKSSIPARAHVFVSIILHMHMWF